VAVLASSSNFLQLGHALVVELREFGDLFERISDFLVLEGLGAVVLLWEDLM
jgi:hypothetical protein